MHLKIVTYGRLNIHESQRTEDDIHAAGIKEILRDIKHLHNTKLWVQWFQKTPHKTFYALISLLLRWLFLMVATLTMSFKSNILTTTRCVSFLRRAYRTTSTKSPIDYKSILASSRLSHQEQKWTFHAKSQRLANCSSPLCRKRIQVGVDCFAVTGAITVRYGKKKASPQNSFFVVTTQSVYDLWRYGQTSDLRHRLKTLRHPRR